MWDLRKWEDPCTKNDSKESEILCGFKGLCPLAGVGTQYPHIHPLPSGRGGGGGSFK